MAKNHMQNVKPKQLADYRLYASCIPRIVQTPSACASRVSCFFFNIITSHIVEQRVLLTDRCNLLFLLTNEDCFAGSILLPDWTDCMLGIAFCVLGMADHRPLLFPMTCQLWLFINWYFFCSIFFSLSFSCEARDIISFSFFDFHKNKLLNVGTCITFYHIWIRDLYLYLIRNWPEESVDQPQINCRLMNDI